MTQHHVAGSESCDFLIIGGGFYGCCLSLFLRSVSERVTLVEAGSKLMDRASRINQARVHSGFHYPRSVLTAVKSMVLNRRFAADFPAAIVDDFQMLYAVARRHSKVPAKRFFRMFAEMGAPIAAATPSQAALFNPDMIEAVFACTEHAFDYSVLMPLMENQLAASAVRVHMNRAVVGIEERSDHVIVRFSDGGHVVSKFVFNVTYSQINNLLRTAGLRQARLKHELTEIALLRPPTQLVGYGVTIMDGPFFSTMPYPAEALYSLTHVRYTPHASWTDNPAAADPTTPRRSFTPDSRHRHMILDGSRYLPCLASSEWIHSLYEIKTVLMKNEDDDGRPILFHRHPSTSRVISILGAKIDNVYDMFDVVRTAAPPLAAADERFLHSSSDQHRTDHG